MKTFNEALEQKLQASLYNNFERENYDEDRYGKLVAKQEGMMDIAKYAVKKAIGWKKSETAQAYLKLIDKYQSKLQIMWQHFNAQDKGLLVELVAYRLLGYQKIKLARNSSAYWENIEKAQSLKISGETYDPHFMGHILNRFDLNPIGFDVNFFFSAGGVAIDYLTEQYAYKLDGKNFIEVEKGDVVLDFGACWGDTALYFAAKTGSEGKVYSFEFIPDNMKLFTKNVALNPQHANQIELVPHPVSNKSGEIIYFKDNGPGSRIESNPFKEQTGSTTTISVDEIVKEKNITKLDFIKMDIEGTEPRALEGALETIRKFRPKLAIATYHSMEDFVNIPTWILDLNLDYEIYLGHYTIHHEETIIFAKPKNK